MDVNKETNKMVQELTLFTLDTFIDFCQKHDLHYYFTGGALIGVMRHSGFIPWDDDIDIGMPRSDFDRFHTLIKKEMPEGFGICDRYTDPKWHFAMSQFIDMRSEIVIDLAKESRTAHIWIDVFPLDGLPEEGTVRWFRVKKILMYRYLIQIANIDTQVDVHRDRPWYEKKVLDLCKALHIGRSWDTDHLLDCLEKNLRKTDFYGAKFCGNLLGRYREREVVPTEWFGNAVYGSFEGRQVKIPAESHRILTALYGDYMKLPPIEARVAHNVKITSYRNLRDR